MLVLSSSREVTRDNAPQSLDFFEGSPDTNHAIILGEGEVLVHDLFEVGGGVRRQSVHHAVVEVEGLVVPASVLVQVLAKVLHPLLFLDILLPMIEMQSVLPLHQSPP